MNGSYLSENSTLEWKKILKKSQIAKLSSG